MKQIAKFIMWLGGWKLIGNLEPEMKKCVFIEAPHTSMWDFVWGRCGLWRLGIKAHFFIKKEMFFFPIGGILKAMGGIPVDRGRKTNLVDNIVDVFNQREEFSLIITPEGTRKYTEHWKKGFYYIALNAKVPIYLAWLDYEKKEGSAGKLFYPSGDYEKDLKIIQKFYKDKVAKHPSQFHLSKEYQTK